MFAATKKRLATSIIGATGAMLAVELLATRAAWSLSKEAQGGNGCACAALNSLSWTGWAAIGFAALFAVGFFAGLVYFFATLIKTRRLVLMIKSKKSGEVQIGKDCQLFLFQAKQCGAFTFGLFWPNVAMCAHCARELPPEEFHAILKHELRHVKEKDPLKFLVFDALKYTFFFVPLIRSLAVSFRVAAELYADEKVDNQEVLGSALLRFADKPQKETLPAFASMLVIRIERILNANRRINFLPSPGALFLAVAFFAAAWFIISGSSRPVQIDQVQCPAPIVCPSLQPAGSSMLNYTPL